MIRMWVADTIHGRARTDMMFSLERKVRLKSQRAVKAVGRQVPALIRREVRRRYTYKEALPIRVSYGDLISSVVVRGRRQTIKHFKVRGGYSERRGQKGKKLYAEIVKGEGGIIKRGFMGDFADTYFKRLTKERYPIKALYGPSTAEMAGHEPEPATTISRRIEECVMERMAAITL